MQVELLQAVLAAWNKEVEADKKAPSMSEEEACAALDLKAGNWGDEELRRAYFRKAAKYHPV